MKPPSSIESQAETSSLARSRPIVHNTVVENVLTDAAQVVEVRIAQFRAALATLLAIFALQTQLLNPVFSHGVLKLGFLVSLFAIAFSLYVITAHRKNQKTSTVPLALFSIGLDAALIVLPVSLFLAAPTTLLYSEAHGGALLNQPTVFAMYFLVIASGLRFRKVAILGILVNGLVIGCLMLMETQHSRLSESYDPVSILAVKQHLMLLVCSVLLAWLISTHIQVTTQGAAQAALQATTDPLTGAFNRSHLRQHLDLLCAREETNVHLVMVDADHFKAINDTMGHLVGDLVLIEIAARLQLALRPSDLLARYGGEEFCIVLPGIDDVVAITIAERLRKTIQDQPIENRTVTVSIGLSRRDPSDATITQLMERADVALYRAKEEGRNRVCAEWPTPIEDKGKPDLVRTEHR